MTRNELMEDVFKKNPNCSPGDIALALSKRFKQFQGNRTLASGEQTKSHYEMAVEFIREKKKQRASSLSNKIKNMKSPMQVVHELGLFSFVSSLAKHISHEFKNEIRENIGISKERNPHPILWPSAIKQKQ